MNNLETLSLAEQLKVNTLSSHQQLEKLLVLQMRSIRSVDDYIALLKIFYSYFGGLEERINLFISEAELPGHSKRRKTESLASDIISLGGVLPEKAGSAQIPLIENTAQAFGALYVIEGSTLGGQIISQMIVKHLALDHGLSFFKGYGEQTNAMWDDFKIVLNKHIAQSEDVINTADAVFTYFKMWIEGHQ